MNILVFFKQYPDEGDEESFQDIGFMNESDKNVLIEALNLRDEYGGSVSVMILGPQKASDVLLEAFTYGTERAILVSDEAFNRSDVRASAKIIGAAIQKIGDYDLILCGRQAIDGDSAHIAVLVADFLRIPHALHSKEVRVARHSLMVRRGAEHEDYLLEVPTPALIMSIKEKNAPRYSAVSNIMKAYGGQLVIEKIGQDDLGLEDGQFGETGSYLLTRRNFASAPEKEKTIHWIHEPTEKESASKLLEVYKRYI